MASSDRNNSQPLGTVLRATTMGSVVEGGPANDISRQPMATSIKNAIMGVNCMCKNMRTNKAGTLVELSVGKERGVLH